MPANTTTALPPDYHSHNSLCKHAVGCPADYARAARHNGVPELACTDHCPTDDGFGIEHRMRLDQFDDYLQGVADARATGVPVLLGIEADYYPGCQRFLEPWIARHPFDVVLGSVHYLDYWSTDPTRRTLAGGLEPELLWKRYFELMGELADTGLYDVAAHFDLPKRFGNALPKDRLRIYAEPALDRLAAAGMALEINTSGLKHACQSCYPSINILTWACERGVGLTFGSDSHNPERVGAGFEHAVALARQAGYTQSWVYRKRKPRPQDLPG